MQTALTHRAFARILSLERALERRIGAGGNRRNLRGGGGMPLEAPLTIPGLKAWFDARTTSHMTIATGISAWVSRAGSLGSIAWTQGTGGNQPAYATAVASLGGKNAVQFDGSDDYFDTNNQNAWKFLHDGTGASRFTVLRLDSTGGATQRYGQTNNASASEHGVFVQYEASAVALRVGNGSGTWLNLWSLGTAAHYARDVSRWQMWGYVDGAQHSRVSGSSLTNADDAAQDPSTNNPSRAFRLGASPVAASPLKGYVAQEIYYDHILTAGETSLLAAWAASVYGVAA